jgi:hypothetical protein
MRSHIMLAYACGMTRASASPCSKSGSSLCNWHGPSEIHAHIRMPFPINGLPEDWKVTPEEFVVK